LGFLKADGQHLGFAPVTDGGWYVGSAEHCIFLWCWYGYLMIIWMMMFYMQYIYISMFCLFDGYIISLPNEFLIENAGA
jgi:hypothetical protein